MTVDELLEQQRAAGPKATESDVSQSVDGAFGIVRAHRERALMVELRKKDGTILAIPYALIELVRYTPGEGILIQAGAMEIRIKGQKLKGEGAEQGLFSALSSHRVLWVREQPRAAPVQSDADCTVIESIEWL